MQVEFEHLKVELCFQFKPEEKIAHESYKKDKSTPFTHNIGLIRLDGLVTLTPSVKPICLPKNLSKASQELRIGNISKNLDEIGDAKAVGWGKLSNDQKPREQASEQVMF